MLCKFKKRLFFDWRRSKIGTYYLNKISEEEEILYNELFICIKTGLINERGTWAHPKVAIQMCYWLLGPKTVKTEKKIKNKLILDEKMVNYKIEVPIKLEYKIFKIDILTETEIIEIKNFKNFMKAIGQILIYSQYYPKHKKRIHFFNIKKDTPIEFLKNICEKYDIRLTFTYKD